MRKIELSKQFSRDVKRISRSGRYRIEELKSVLTNLASDTPLPERFNDHALVGEWVNHRECHIRPDWLLIYCLAPGILFLTRTGSHSELFG